jgi:hypothetical protein
MPRALEEAADVAGLEEVEPNLRGVPSDRLEHIVRPPHEDPAVPHVFSRVQIVAGLFERRLLDELGGLVDPGLDLDTQTNVAIAGFGSASVSRKSSSGSITWSA